MDLNINGAVRVVDVNPDTPLLYVLRNDLGLVGSRFGCGSGLCGACFVLVDGRPMASCDLPISFVAGKKVTTVEGLGSDGELHPVQKALIDEQAAQCGYCANGMIIAAADLLKRNPQPTEAQVREGLAGHLCRCGTYNRIVRAVLRAAQANGRT